MSDENNSRDKNYRFAIAHLLILILFAYMGFFGDFQIADHMAKNPDNIIKGCMYYVREVRDDGFGWRGGSEWRKSGVGYLVLFMVY